MRQMLNPFKSGLSINKTIGFIQDKNYFAEMRIR